MRCNECGLVIPYHKAPQLTECSIDGTPLVPDIRDILEHGKYGIAQEIRPTQVALGQRVEEVLLKDRATLLAEGGTGIGKSFAYLLPTLLQTKSRVVISTAKKTLQDQLANKDIPFLLKKMGINCSYGIYKGKSNYACWKLSKEVPLGERKKFQRFVDAARHQRSPADVANWLGAVPTWWPKISIENCVLGSACPHFSQCRPQPKDYNIVVTNHYLTAIDLKNTAGALFGPYDILVLDEAHQAPEAFRSTYSQSLTQKGIDILCGTYTNDNFLRNVLDNCGFTSAVKMNQRFNGLDKNYAKLFSLVRGPGNYVGAFEIKKYSAPLEHLTAHTADLGNILMQVEAHLRRQFEASESGNPEYSTDEILAAMSRVGRLIKRTTNAYSFLEDTLANTEEKFLSTCDERGLHLLPMNVGDIVGPQIAKIKHKVILSATLAINGNFSHSEKKFGLAHRMPEEELLTECFPSPFQLDKQAVLYIPTTMPIPAHAGKPQERELWITKLAQEIERLLTVTYGDSFVLFSAKSDMYAVIDELGPAYWENMGMKLILHAGEATATLEAFKNTRNSVLFGLKSFWEGVDVAGDKLKMVIIPKLPFPNPKDPLIAAHSEKAGRNSFQEVMLPSMFFDMKQGCGRLIRSRKDRGFIAILDPRVWTGTSNPGTHSSRLSSIARDPKRRRLGYGKELLDVLGFTQITDDFSIVQKMARKFFRS